MTDAPKPAVCPCCDGPLTPQEAACYGRCENCYIHGLKLPGRSSKPPHYDQAPGSHK